MALHYDTTLKNKLRSRNQFSDIVLNKQFNGWAPHIEENLRIRSYSGGDDYHEGLDNELLQDCKWHIDKNRTGKLGKQTVILTHPFYLQLTQMDELNTRKIEGEVRDYSKNLLKFLYFGKNNPNVNFVALDTIHTYAATTSLLLERGLVGDVLFTEYDSGILLNPEELEEYKDDEIFFAGGYDYQCLRQVINKVIDKDPSGKLWGIKDLILTSPKWNYKTLKPRTISGIPQSQIISLEETIERLNLR